MMRGMLRLCSANLLLAVLAPAVTGQTPPPAGNPTMQRFANRNGSFHVDLPAGWRQLAPNEALRLSELPGAPRDLWRAEPRSQYAIGPVDAWMRGDFGGPWLYVTEIVDAAVLPADFEAVLPRLWQAHGEANDLQHNITDIRSETVGSLNHPVRTAIRTTRAADGGGACTSLDAYTTSGRQQLTLAFTCAAADFERYEATFRAWLQTASFARPARVEATLTDRLWSPLWTGAAVSLVLLMLYKHSRRKR